jgi:hypothetical protein
MSSPYTPPQSGDLPLPSLAASEKVRTIVRFLGMVDVLAATVLGSVLWKIEAMSRGLSLFDAPSNRLLAGLLLRHGGALPFIGAVLLAGLGVIFSFRDRARALPMLAFVIASLLLTGMSLVGLMYLISEVLRKTGGA